MAYADGPDPAGMRADERRAGRMYAVALTDERGFPLLSCKVSGESLYLARDGLHAHGVRSALKFGTAADATCWVEAEELSPDWTAVVGVLPRAMAEAEARAREEWEHRGTVNGNC